MKTKQSMGRTEKLLKMKDEFGGKCAMCDEARIWVLAFHHTNPRKESGRPSWTIVRDWTFEEIMNEYRAETVLLCRNCHGDVHYHMNQKLRYNDD